MRISATIILGAALALCACHDKRPAEGPMEYSGRKVDEGAHKTKEGVKEGAHDTKCAAKNAKDDLKNQRRDPNCY
jgi:hypothetical protein